MSITDKKNSTPILFIIFNRPDLTKRVFDRIREAQPQKLFIAADGPREYHPDDLSLSLKAREIINEVDWECDVKTLFQNHNLGCRNAVSNAISWFFSFVEKGIILEDDCLPDISFFKFCEELLDLYKDEPLVMSIGGNNFFFKKRIMNSSYSFTKYPHIWGWATWRRSWIKFQSWNPNFDPFDYSIFPNISERLFWLDKINEIRTNKMDYTWDYQWSLVCMASKSLCIYPSVNLVSNIGFGVNATHTMEVTRFANLPTAEITFPLLHPYNYVWNEKIDAKSSELFFRKKQMNRFLVGLKKIKKNFQIHLCLQ